MSAAVAAAGGGEAASTARLLKSLPQYPPSIHPFNSRYESDPPVAAGQTLDRARGPSSARADLAALLKESAKPAVGALLALEPFIANLGDEDGKRYLKATLQVEFFGARVPDEFHRAPGAGA